MNIENVINKWHYNEELSTFLRKVYEEFINYFGADLEPIIYEAFLNTEIILSEKNPYEVLKERGLLDEDDVNMVSFDDLKRASGVRSSYPNIIFDGTNFEIKDITRVVSISKPTLELEYIKAVLIHELGHMIKSYFKEYSIEGNKLITRSGLIETVEELSFEDGKVKRKLISERGVGIEEGLNSALEESIARKLVNPEYKVSGYGVVNLMANTLNEELGLKPLILKAQMLKEKGSLIEELNSEIKEGFYMEIEDIADRIYKLTLKAFSEIMDTPKMEKTSEEIRKIIINEYNPLMDSVFAMKRG